jgi:hypothetical protein
LVRMGLRQSRLTYMQPKDIALRAVAR